MNSRVDPIRMKTWMKMCMETRMKIMMLKMKIMKLKMMKLKMIKLKLKLRMRMTF